MNNVANMVAASKSFNRWLDTLVEEKGLDREQTFDVEGPSGLNVIPLGVVISTIKVAPKHERDAIKTMLVKIDFVNGNVVHFFGHLAKALAV